MAPGAERPPPIPRWRRPLDRVGRAVGAAQVGSRDPPSGVVWTWRRRISTWRRLSATTSPAGPRRCSTSCSACSPATSSCRSSPPWPGSATVPIPFGSAARRPGSIRRPGRFCPAMPAATSRSVSPTSAAVTGGRRCAQPVRGCTRQTCSTSSGPASPAARRCRSRWLRTRWCSPHSPRRRSGMCTTHRRADVQIAAPAIAATARRCIAWRATATTIPSWASRCASTATTTPPRLCGSGGRRTCGVGSPSRCVGCSRRLSACPAIAQRTWRPCSTRRWPSTSAAASSISTP